MPTISSGGVAALAVATLLTGTVVVARPSQPVTDLVATAATAPSTTLGRPASPGRVAPDPPDGVAPDPPDGRQGTWPVRGVRAAPAHRWAWPLSPTPRVARRFAAAVTAYGRGHRGVDLVPAADGAVRAVAAGTVTHVGVVAGRGTVTVLHAGGLRSTYEPVRAGVVLGQRVERGEVIGSLSGPSHCDPEATCLHLGALRGEIYVDPMHLILGGPAVLLPMGAAALRPPSGRG